MWRRRRTDDDFAAEVRAHLESEIDRLVDEGMSRDDARAAAHRRFGNVARARERFHDTYRAIWFEQLTQDLRYAWRGLRRSRAFVATTVLTLAVGMGLVTAVFAIVNAYVLRPFAVHDPYSLYSIRWRAQESAGLTFRWSDYDAIRSRRDLFDGVVAEAARHVSSQDSAVSVGFVSGNYFELLGARVALGRALTVDDARAPGSEPVTVLTDQAWARLFDRDPGVLGREILMNGQKLTVVGVMAPEFVGLEDVPRDAWVPLTMYSALAAEDPFGASRPRLLQLTARLRHDVTPQQVSAALPLEPFETTVAGRVDAVRADLQQRATPVQITATSVAFLTPVFAAFVLVLVAACANASNVMLARANARHREIGIRLSIGASRSRIVRQLLTEGLLIAILAGAGGLGLARMLLRVGVWLFVAMLPPTIAARVRLVPLDFDARVFLFTFGVAAAAMMLFALLPALQATRVVLTDALRGQASGTVRHSTLRNLLVTGQVAVSLVLLIVATTLVGNAAAIRTADVGLDTAGVVSVRPRQEDSKLVAPAYEAMTGDPRVAQIAVASRSPLFGDMPRVPLKAANGFVAAAYTFVSPDYFPLLHMPIVRGRGFSAAEAAAEAPVAIISARGASTLWPNEDPLGKTVRVYIEPRRARTVVHEMTKTLRRMGDDVAGAVVVTIVGVTTDVISGFVYQGKDPAHLYLPTSPTGSRAAALLVRGPSSVVPNGAVRSLLQDVDLDPLTFDVLAVDEMVALQMFPLRAASYIGLLLSTVALGLSVSGLYGVLTYTFGQRIQEIGVRMALGASARAITRLVLVYAVRLATLGAIVGTVIGFLVMSGLAVVVRLDNVSVLSPLAFASSLALIVAAVALASYGPARRAARVDPSTLLRADA